MVKISGSGMSRCGAGCATTKSSNIMKLLAALKICDGVYVRIVDFHHLAVLAFNTL
jgi:hypothetical protein